MQQSVPEENRDRARCNFCANFAFLRKIAIFRKFCLGAQFLRKFPTLRRAIFREVCKFCNLRAILAHFQRNFRANSTNYTKNLRLPYCISFKKTVKNFLSQPQNIYAQLSGIFLRIFQRSFHANFAFFPRDFLQGLNSCTFFKRCPRLSFKMDQFALLKLARFVAAGDNGYAEFVFLQRTWLWMLSAVGLWCENIDRTVGDLGRP